MPGSPPCGHTEGSCLPCHRRSWNPLDPDRRAAATRQAHHPLGCLRPIPDRIIFDELIQVLVFGCGCAGSPTPAARRPPCAAAATNGSAPGGRAAAPCGAGRLRPAVRPGVGAPGGGRLHHQGALRRAGRGPSPVDRRKRGLKRSMVTEAGGIPLATLPAQPITRRRAAGGDAGHHRLVGVLPERPVVHLDAGYGWKRCRQGLGRRQDGRPDRHTSGWTPPASTGGRPRAWMLRMAAAR
jgi:hypothetical protein